MQDTSSAPNAGSPQQNTRRDAEHALPDWRNLGVLLRIILGVNLLVVLASLIQARGFYDWLGVFLANSIWAECPLLFNLIVLALMRNQLKRCPPRLEAALVYLLVGLTTLLYQDAWHYLSPSGSEHGSALRALLLALGVTWLMLFYFRLRARHFAPRIEEARLQALNARIRPHFLFNSLNTVLGLIRREPKRAELALEELSDLFRALMREPRELVPLSEEIALGRQYLDLEKLRLGERLRISWDVRRVPLETLVPPLMLQPLLENAVHHGIESAIGEGEIHVLINMKGDMLTLSITNPLGTSSGRGNHMALGNIRARLALFYDMEAKLEHGPRELSYQVTIELPCRYRNPPL
ncbi:MAG: histidine kinase [Zoogloeaceae bacterium]|jgi:two-component system sensor histidine kinase AlgZ|nr:histidine kinase [Zoogloeaceae bacterium]